MLLLADLVVLLHAAFILFVMAGGLLLWRWPRLVWLHLPAVVWAVALEVGGWLCPLTPLENWLREEAGYAGSFIGHYLLPIIYPAGLTQEIQWLLAAVVLAVNLPLYILLGRRYLRRGSGR